MVVPDTVAMVVYPSVTVEAVVSCGIIPAVVAGITMLGVMAPA